jgi:hypothetical protein
MVALPAGLRPALTMPAGETVAASPELVMWQPDIEASRSEPGTSHFDVEASQPVGPMSQWAGAALWP